MSNEQVVKKGPKRAAIAPDARLLVGREDAAEMLSISSRVVDYLVANKKLRSRRIGARVLIPVSELRRFSRNDHPEALAS
jgi:excisionase family DNA binding protein